MLLRMLKKASLTSIFWQVNSHKTLPVPHPLFTIGVWEPLLRIQQLLRISKSLLNGTSPMQPIQLPSPIQLSRKSSNATGETSIQYRNPPAAFNRNRNLETYR